MGKNNGLFEKVIHPENPEGYANWVKMFGLYAPYGYCQCGCGHEAPILTYNISKKQMKLYGWQKGEPARYKQGHYNKFKGNIKEQLLSGITVDDSSGCWLWTKGKNSDGYGFLMRDRCMIGVHRLSFMVFRGDIPIDMLVCHRCDVRNCINPEHLYLGTHADNMKDMSERKRTKFQDGENNSSVKLTRSQVVDILNRWSEGEPQSTLAEEYEVSPATIHCIVRRKTWTHVNI
jgi:hypothetical protein